MALFLTSSAHCAVREDTPGVFVFHDPAAPSGQAVGSWAEVVALATRILVHEARTNGGTPGLLFAAAEAYAQGIAQGTITEGNVEFAENLLATIAALKAT